MAPRRPSLFRRGLGTRSMFSSSSSTVGSGEIDMRVELDELFFGFESGIRHGHLVVVRHLRRDADGAPTSCTCRDSITRFCDPDCSYCGGEGYLWDESWYWTYSMYTGNDAGKGNRVRYMPPGALRVDYRVFFFRFDTPIRYGDKVVEMKLDEEGTLVVPYIRESIYLPQTIQKYRSDNGRIEYYAVYCREEDAKRSDTPE